MPEPLDSYSYRVYSSQFGGTIKAQLQCVKLWLMFIVYTSVLQ